MYTVTPTSRSMGHNWLGPLPYEDRRWTSRSPTPRSSSASGVKCAPGWRPTCRRASRARRSPTRTASRRYRELRAFGRKLGDKGWLYPRAPKAVRRRRARRRLTRSSSRKRSTASASSLPPYYDSGGRLGSATIQVWGTEEQKQAFLPPIYRGEVRTWQLLTEPGAGSDLAGVTTAAIRDGDEYVLNGQKIFVGSDHGADRIWMIACTKPRRPAPRERLVVHDRRQPARHHRAAHGAHGHRRRGRHRSGPEEHRLLRLRCGCPRSRWSAARTTAGRRPARISSWSTARAAASAAIACGIACCATARRPSATACRSASTPTRAICWPTSTSRPRSAPVRPAQLLADLRRAGRAPTRARSSPTTAR